MMNDQTQSTGFRWTTLLRPRWSISLFVAALALLRLSVEFIPTRIEIGPETTVLEGPLRPDGSVDYVGPLDEQLRSGVSPDDNAVVDLVQAFGPDEFCELANGDYWQALGIDPSMIEGPFFVDDSTFRSTQGITPGSPEDKLARDDYYAAIYQPWSADQNALLAKWLQRNENSLNRILAASRRRDYYAPVVVNPDCPCLYLSQGYNLRLSWDAARLLCIASMRALADDDVSQAFEYVLAVHRLARLMTEGEPGSISTFGCNNDAMATVCDAAIVLSEKVTLSQAVEFRKQLKALPEFPSIVDVVDREERWVALDLIQAAFTGRADFRHDFLESLPAPGTFDPNLALREINHVADKQVAALKLRNRLLRNRALDDLRMRYGEPYQFDSRQLQLAQLLGIRALAGRHCAERAPWLILRRVELLVWMWDGMPVREQQAETVYAIAEYRARHGDFPESLAALVPSVLSELPVDPYSNAASPLLYRRRGEQFVLYSIGENGVDDGGRWYKGGDDIAVGATTDSPDDE